MIRLKFCCSCVLRRTNKSSIRSLSKQQICLPGPRVGTNRCTKRTVSTLISPWGNSFSCTSSGWACTRCVHFLEPLPPVDTMIQCYTCRCRMLRRKRCTNCSFCCCPRTPTLDRGPCLRTSSRKCARREWRRSKPAQTIASPSSIANIRSWLTTSIPIASAVTCAAQTAGWCDKMVKNGQLKQCTTFRLALGSTTSSVMAKSHPTSHRTTWSSRPDMSQSPMAGMKRYTNNKNLIIPILCSVNILLYCVFSWKLY